MSAEIKEAIGGEVTLVGGGGGVFEIRRDGEVLWAKVRKGPFPAPGEAAALFA
ncbi:MAG: hypothetical protein OSA48_05470 [Akkermansiaceae bacterium]|nr:hypothetical protein [Akkermansiaceae bacterium]